MALSSMLNNIQVSDAVPEQIAESPGTLRLLIRLPRAKSKTGTNELGGVAMMITDLAGILVFVAAVALLLRSDLFR
jgi:hypothetical protein